MMMTKYDFSLSNNIQLDFQCQANLIQSISRGGYGGNQDVKMIFTVMKLTV
jgi:hypothetical protein